jgi:hypothetical protein
MSQRTFLLIAALAAALSAFLQDQRGGDFLPGDCRYYAFTAESILRDGDLDLTNQLLGDEPLETAREKLRPHEGFFAVSPADRVVPKHSILLPLVSLPFAAIFGVYGFLIANVLIAIALVAGVADLAGNSPASRAAALAIFATSSWLIYCFNFSPDLLVAALIAWSYAMARRERWLLAGLLAGLAVWAKVYAAIIMLPLAIVILPAGWRASIRAAAAALVGMTPMFVLNVMLYGGPLVTGYDRDGRVTTDGFTVREHYSRFNQPFINGLGNVLFDREAGMIRTAPLWFLWPLGFVLAWKTRMPFSRRFTTALALGAMANVFVFALYEAWNQTIYGNRFLFPAVALGGALLTPIAIRYFPRLR